MRTLSSLLLALALVAGVTSSAFAGGPWSGCYLGAHAGVSISNTVATLDAPGFPGAVGIDGLGASGVAGGATGGCDVQMGLLVVGVFGDWTKHDSDFKVTSSLIPTDVATMSLQSQWSIGGRVGVVLHDTAMLYVLGGYTEASFSDLSVLGGKASWAIPDASGYILGGGAEMALPMKGFFVDLRYTYSHLDRFDIDVSKGAGFVLGLQPDIHTARVGITYKIGGDPIASISSLKP